MNIKMTVGEPLGAGTGTIDASETTAESALELAEAAKNKLVVVSPDAPSRCIDGRNCKRCLDGTHTDPRPAVAGGALITAYGAAELAGWFSSDDARPSDERLEDVAAVLEHNGIVMGGHCDEGSLATNYVNVETNAIKTGCGADDQLPVILSKPALEKETVDTLTHALLDEEYDASAAHFEQPQVIGWNPKKALDIVSETNGNATEVLVGSHAEELVIFNYIEGTTVDRDALVTETGRQVFVVDMWYIKKLSTALAAGRPDAVKMEKQLLHAMVAYQVGTYLTLCNGTQRPVFLKPEASPMAA